MTPDDGYVHQQVRVGDGDESVSAELVTPVSPHGTARIVVHAHPGHVAPGLRGTLIDALLDAPAVRDSDLLASTLPLGDTESLFELVDRCDDVTVHSAGSSALVDARLRDAP